MSAQRGKSMTIMGILASLIFLNVTFSILLGNLPEGYISGESPFLERTGPESECPPNHILVGNKILPEEVTHLGIPRIIHFFARSKCLPIEIANNMHRWTSLLDHSVLIHDKKEVYAYLSKQKNNPSYVSKAIKCAVTHEAIWI